jgi:hypothetical protein
MKRLAILVLVLSAGISAQEPADTHQHTTPPSDARFEVIQSELAAKWTFRLDRFTGHIDQLVKSSDGGSMWEAMLIVGLPPVESTHARFQLFTSGLAAKFTFLIDTTTGKTWELASSKTKLPDGTESEDLIWQRFVE